MEEQELNFEEWQKTVPDTIRSEKFWLLIAYQKALYLYDYRAKAFYPQDTLGKRLYPASEVVALLLTEINRQKGR